MTPSVSVVVCTWNRAPLLRACLRSLEDQTVDPAFFEVLVVDNNSSDGTDAVVREFALRRPNFRGVREERQGLSHARNRGWAEACGEYVAYLDDDGKAPPRWLAGMRDMLGRASPDVFGGPYYPCYDAPKPPWYLDRYATQARDGGARPLESDEFLSGGNLVIRRSLLERHGGFRAAFGMAGRKIAYAEETDLLRRIRAAEPGTRVWYDPALFIYHHVRPEKMTLAWIARQKYASGLYAQRVFRHADGVDPGRLRLLARGARTVAGFGADLARGLFLRDRARYPDVRNFLFEVAFVRLQDLGRIRERIRQVGAGREGGAESPAPEGREKGGASCV